MPRTTVKFIKDVLTGEVDVVNRRRNFVADGRLCKDRIAADDKLAKDSSCRLPSKAPLVPIEVGDPPDKLDKHSIPRLDSEQDIVGLACSGGGVRSSAFCLGVFQGLDSINPNNAEPQVLDAVDYLSTVSGGGYIATSVAAGLMQKQGQFPFESKLDDQETPETKHLRDNSNYLIPRGFFDILVGLTAVLRGLVANAIIFLGIILWLAAATVCYFAKESALHKTAYFGWTTVAFFGILVASQFFYVFVGRMRSLTKRQTADQVFTWLLLFLAIFTFFELQS